MDVNPYASPAARPAEQARSPLALGMAFVFSFFLLFVTLPRIWGNGILPIDADYDTFVKAVLAESAVSAVLGIAAFTKLGRADGIPARLMYLGRAICVAQLVVTGAMLPLLRRNGWYIHYTYIIPTILTFACIEVILLHFALRRFEHHSRLASLTLIAVLIVDVGIGIIANAYRTPYVEHYKITEFLHAVGLELGQAVVCLLLALRLFEIRRTWRSKEQPHCNDDSSYASTQ